MITNRMVSKRIEFEPIKNNFMFVVENTLKTKEKTVKVTSMFEKIEDAVHKIELDLITNCLIGAYGMANTNIIIRRKRQSNGK